MSEILALEDILNTRDPKEAVSAGLRKQEMGQELYPEHDPNKTGIFTMEQIMEKERGIKATIDPTFERELSKDVRATKRAGMKFPDNKQIVIEPLRPWEVKQAKERGEKDFYQYVDRGLRILVRVL